MAEDDRFAAAGGERETQPAAILCEVGEDRVDGIFLIWSKLNLWFTILVSQGCRARQFSRVLWRMTHAMWKCRSAYRAEKSAIAARECGKMQPESIKECGTHVASLLTESRMVVRRAFASCSLAQTRGLQTFSVNFRVAASRSFTLHTSTS